VTFLELLAYYNPITEMGFQHNLVLGWHGYQGFNREISAYKLGTLKTIRRHPRRRFCDGQEGACLTG
jgi:hypothetical protein